MNESKSVENLAKEIDNIRDKLNAVVAILAIFIILAIIQLIQTIYSLLVTNPAFMILIIISIIILAAAFVVGLLIYIDIRRNRATN